MQTSRAPNARTERTADEADTRSDSLNAFNAFNRCPDAPVVAGQLNAFTGFQGRILVGSSERILRFREIRRREYGRREDCHHWRNR